MHQERAIVGLQAHITNQLPFAAKTVIEAGFIRLRQDIARHLALAEVRTMNAWFLVFHVRIQSLRRIVLEGSICLAPSSIPQSPGGSKCHNE